MLEDEDSRRAVEVAERFAEGTTDDEELARAFDVGFAAAIGEWSAYAAAHAAEPEATWAARLAASFALDAVPDLESEPPAQAALLRCIVGTPFRAAPDAGPWRTPAVVALAQAIYLGQAFNRLPDLANLVEQAGCTHMELLVHMRSPAPHARGCFPLDSLLGKQ